MRVVKFAAIGLILAWLALWVVNNNPELYKVMPGFIVEGDIGSAVNPGIGVSVHDVFTLPGNGARPSLINYIIPYPGRNDVLVYNDMRGKIGLYEERTPTELPFLDLLAIAGSRFKSGNLELGLISFAFHPDFAIEGAAGEGKFFTVHSEATSARYDNTTIPYFGLIEGGAHHLSIISEWTVSDGAPMQVDPASQRVLLVLEQPYYDHNIYHIAFDPFLQPGDDDYGMLYIGVGNGGRMSHLELDDSTLFGKILRIDPLNGDEPGYAVPPTNPFVGTSRMRPEVWAYGFRNPQQFSWDMYSGKMYSADIGQSNIEEINIIDPGADYGWSYFEGRYLVSRASLDKVKKSLLPLALFPITFPVAEYDHRYGKAVAGGFVYRGRDIPQLHGMYIFGDIVSGRLFYFDTKEIDSGDRAQLFELYLFDGHGATTMAELVGNERVDLRLGLDARGEILLVNKHDNCVRRLSGL